MTTEQKKNLLQITDNLMKTKTSQRFQKPFTHATEYFMVDNDGYMVKKEPMNNLRTWKRKLIDGGYASLQEYERDFRLIIDIALYFHAPESEAGKDAQSLNAEFEDEMMML